MKKGIAAILLCTLLSGCGGQAPDRAAALRSRFLSQGCTFDARITADYGQAVWEFSLDCQADGEGCVQFTVTAPEEIAGIRGQVCENGAALLFDGQALGFPLLADGLLSPAGAPWMLLHTLRRGCIRSCAAAGEGLMLCIDDRYEEKAVTLEVRTDGEDLPAEAEFFWEGRRILVLSIENFRFV